MFSEEDLDQKRIESYQIAIKMERRDGLQSLSRAIIIILIDTIEKVFEEYKREKPF